MFSRNPGDVEMLSPGLQGLVPLVLLRELRCSSAKEVSIGRSGGGKQLRCSAIILIAASTCLSPRPSLPKLIVAKEPSKELQTLIFFA